MGDYDEVEAWKASIGELTWGVYSSLQGLERFKNPTGGYFFEIVFEGQNSIEVQESDAQLFIIVLFCFGLNMEPESLFYYSKGSPSYMFLKIPATRKVFLFLQRFFFGVITRDFCKDFNGQNDALEIAIYIAQLRDSQSKELKGILMPELRALGKSWGLKFKSNMKKVDLLRFMVHGRCNSGLS